VAVAGQAELVFVVDLTSLTKKGFVGSTVYQGKAVDLEFDDGDEGVVLSSEMAARLRVRKGSKILLAAENEHHIVTDAVVTELGKAIRISNPKIYYEVGKEGGAILKIRKG